MSFMLFNWGFPTNKFWTKYMPDKICIFFYETGALNCYRHEICCLGLSLLFTNTMQSIHLNINIEVI